METIKIIYVLLASSVCVFILDFCCYYQASIITELSQQKEATSSARKNPSFHPFVHPILWILASFIVIQCLIAFAFDLQNGVLGYLFAGTVAVYFGTRWWLIAKGIS